MEQRDISTELWREYDWKSNFEGDTRCYRIVKPVALWVGTTTHRVLDSNGIVHCIPTVGSYGCVLRWQNKDPKNPVNF